jgi:hypothetical protein
VSASSSDLLIEKISLIHLIQEQRLNPAAVRVSAAKSIIVCGARERCQRSVQPLLLKHAKQETRNFHQSP